MLQIGTTLNNEASVLQSFFQIFGAWHQGIFQNNQQSQN
jgi:hypothetical protein